MILIEHHITLQKNLFTLKKDQRSSLADLRLRLLRLLQGRVRKIIFLHSVRMAPFKMSAPMKRDKHCNSNVNSSSKPNLITEDTSQLAQKTNAELLDIKSSTGKVQ